MAESHGHAHGPGAHAGHSHAPADFGRAFLIGTILNTGFVIVEATFGILANSMALLADAGHNLSDVAGLLVAWGAASLAKRGPTRHYTYGFRRSSILAALFNAIFLLVAIGAIGFEAIQRFANPEPVSSATVIIVAAIGIAINTVTALLFARGRTGDINIRGAYLHMAADAAVSAGVVVAGLVITKTGWFWLDPLTSLAIVAVIFIGTWGLLKDSVGMSLDRVPAGIPPADVEQMLAALPGVERVHDLHIWGMSTTEVAMTCHLVMPGGTAGDQFLHETSAALEERFGIAHTTIQVETGDEADCDQAPDTVV
ncbi:cation diffusion facilitator family transporter [Allosphingosinicella sp.]|uniref:cation diffusion facilitator family transporter n=1 Tax=Allosphingosinicella sp. TaxID=2823234 RepID=UPI003782DAE7